MDSKLSLCSRNPYQNLQILVLENKPVSCQICQRMLQKFQFNRDDLEKVIQACLRGERQVSCRNYHVPKDAVEKIEEPEDEEDVTLDVLTQKAPATKRRKKTKMDPEAEREAIQKWIDDLGCFKLLPPGTYGKKVPYRCLLCKTPQWPNGFVGEADCVKLDSIQYFLGKHMTCRRHRQESAKEIVSDVREEAVCTGISLDDPECSGLLYEFREEVALWIDLSNLDVYARHQYQKTKKESWIIKASQCIGCYDTSARQPAGACKECLKMTTRSGIVKNVLRFMRKYWVAHLLNVKLFSGQKVFDEYLAKVKETNLYQAYRPYFDTHLSYTTWQMQQFVSVSFLSDNWVGPSLQSFIDTMVRPCTSINVQSVPAQLHDVIARFTAIIRGDEASEQDMLESAFCRVHSMSDSKCSGGTCLLLLTYGFIYSFR